MRIRIYMGPETDANTMIELSDFPADDFATVLGDAMATLYGPADQDQTEEHDDPYTGEGYLFEDPEPEMESQGFRIGSVDTRSGEFRDMEREKFLDELKERIRKDLKLLRDNPSILNGRVYVGDWNGLLP